MKWVLGAALAGAWLVACGSGSKNSATTSTTSGDATAGSGGTTGSSSSKASSSSAATASSTNASASSSSASASSSSTGGGCQKPIFAKVVSNMANPMMMGTGFGPAWSYNAMSGLQAAKAMCAAVGADHLCTYQDIVAADLNGELASLPTNLTYWLHRTSAVMDDVQGSKACDPTKNDPMATPPGHNPGCDGGGITADTCDAGAKICVFKPGAGGRCNEWTYQTNHVSNGEWFQPAAAANPNPGGVKCGDALCTKATGGSLLYHFDRNPNYDGTTLYGCKANNMTGCSGGCAGETRAILCCHPC